ncbi:MAG: hypothetical protein ACI857_000571 [Arenicella sp.]|jgi:hypothetical protein
MKIQGYIYRVILVLIGLATNLALFAQPSSGPPPGGGGSTGSTPPCWDPECVPVDGGLGFLIVAGAALGAKKINDHRKKMRA